MRNQEHGVNVCLKVLITIVAEVLRVVLHFLCERAGIRPSPHTGTSVGRAWVRGEGRERGEGGEGERDRREGREKEIEGRGGRKRKKEGEGEKEKREGRERGEGRGGEGRGGEGRGGEGRGGEGRGGEGRVHLSCIVHVHVHVHF